MLKLFTLYIYDPDIKYGGWFDMYLKIFATDIQSAECEARKVWTPIFKMVEI